MRTAKTLIRLGGCPEADLSLRWAHTHFDGFVISWLKSKTSPYHLIIRAINLHVTFIAEAHRGTSVKLIS